MRAQEQDREEIAQARAHWENDQKKIPAARLVFIDETGTSTQMSRRYGQCAKKRRLIGKALCGHWKTTAFVAALRSRGLTAPMVLDGPINGESFRAWVQQSLLPTLRPGDVVVMDNLAAHKVTGMRQTIESSGAKLSYLPTLDINLFLRCAPRDPVVFDTGEFSDSVRRTKRAKVLQIKVVTDVGVKVAIN